jgi:hypothetical protein
MGSLGDTEPARLLSWLSPDQGQEEPRCQADRHRRSTRCRHRDPPNTHADRHRPDPAHDEFEMISNVGKVGLGLVS